MADLDVEAFAAAQQKEYGTYIAKAPIDIDGVRAFSTGHPVPVGHVTSGLVDPDLVEQVGQQAPPKTAAPAATATEVKG